MVVFAAEHPCTPVLPIFAAPCPTSLRAGEQHYSQYIYFASFHTVTEISRPQASAVAQRFRPRNLEWKRGLKIKGKKPLPPCYRGLIFCSAVRIWLQAGWVGGEGVPWLLFASFFYVTTGDRGGQLGTPGAGPQAAASLLRHCFMAST